MNLHVCCLAILLVATACTTTLRAPDGTKTIKEPDTKAFRQISRSVVETAADAFLWYRRTFAPAPTQTLYHGPAPTVIVSEVK